MRACVRACECVRVCMCACVRVCACVVHACVRDVFAINDNII